MTPPSSTRSGRSWASRNQAMYRNRAASRKRLALRERTSRIRRQTVAILDDLTAKAGWFELADPPAALGRYRQKLRENAYKVLVVGEAKRGKSTFVNALIGRDILPTDVEVATSQVFNVRPAKQEAYRVRYEDGSVQEI